MEDDAQAHELKEWENRNKPRLSSGFKPGEPGYGPPECMQCGGDMPDIRRGYGYRVCTSCQERLELRSISAQRR